MCALTKEEIEYEYNTLCLTQKQIAERHGLTQSDISEAMKNHGLVARPKGKIVDLTGKKFGRLTVVQPIPRSPTNYTFRWKCRCDCGNYTQVRRGNLVYGLTKSCGCLKQDKIGDKHHAWRGYGHIPGGFISKYKSHAKRRGIPFDLSIEYVNHLFEFQDGRCAYTNTKLSFEHYGYKGEYSNASLDRRDSSLGYIEGNVQWVLTEINFMKQSLSENRFVELCEAVCERQKTKTSPHK